MQTTLGAFESCCLTSRVRLTVFLLFCKEQITRCFVDEIKKNSKVNPKVKNSGKEDKNLH
jgi:hypothetical protein